MSYNCISQKDIQNKKVVILTENQAKSVIKDLVHYDALKEIVKEKDIQIENYIKKETIFKKLLQEQDTIIGKQSILIDNQNKLLKSYDRIKIHAYIGIQTNKLNIEVPEIRGSLLIEKDKISAGAVYTINKNNWGLLIQYKLF